MMTETETETAANGRMREIDGDALRAAGAEIEVVRPSATGAPSLGAHARALAAEVQRRAQAAPRMDPTLVQLLDYLQYANAEALFGRQALAGLAALADQHEATATRPAAAEGAVADATKSVDPEPTAAAGGEEGAA